MVTTLEFSSEPSFVAHLACIGNATRNEAEKSREKRVFIGKFEDFSGRGTQRAPIRVRAESVTSYLGNRSQNQNPRVAAGPVVGHT
jgi:hypothetical protein